MTTIQFDDPARAYEATAEMPVREYLECPEYLMRDATRPSDAGPDLDEAFDLVTGVYVAPYASTTDQLRGLSATARRALPAVGGRFVTYDCIAEPADRNESTP